VYQPSMRLKLSGCTRAEIKAMTCAARYPKETTP
jgi:hypothetical protein